MQLLQRLHKNFDYGFGLKHWSNASNQTRNQSSYVNVATTATIDVNTRLLTVFVEAYYTGASPVASNRLNVALLQNNATSCICWKTAIQIS